ncbi:MAG: siroheme synthase CysG [Pseudomonadota bacterium]
MRYFPAFFDIKERPVYIAGDDELAVRKARLLAKAYPRLEVFSVSKGSLIEREFGSVAKLHDRPLEATDFDPRPALVVAATDDEEEDERIAYLTKAHGVPVNVVDQPHLCDVVIPSIVERGDVAIGISTGGGAPVMGRRLRERIESILPSRMGELLSFARDRRARVAEAVAPDDRRSFWERLLSGPVAEAVYDGDMDGAESGFLRALGASEGDQGIIHIVGAGPGDPELLTLKALRVLQEADIVLYDNLVSDAVLDLIRRDAERRYVGKQKANHSMTQEDIGALMVSLAQAGKRVVRLKGGDPYIFGRGGEEVDMATQAGVPVKVVPGITAATGCAAASSIPLTHRGVSQAVTYVTAHAGKGGAPNIDWEALAALGHTIVVYMGVGRARQIAFDLTRAGLPSETPAAIVENGTLPTQRIIRTSSSELGNAVLEAGVDGPAVLIIGEVAARADGKGLVDLLHHEGVAA